MDISKYYVDHVHFFCFFRLFSILRFNVRRFPVSFLALALFLTACGGGDSGRVVCDQDYWDGTIGTCLPENWFVVDSETLRQRGVPDDVVVAFQDEEPVSGQFPTVTITREKLARPVSPSDYSNASIRSVEVLPGYEQLDTSDVRVADAGVRLHVFSAKPNADEPQRRFYQVSTVHGEYGYTITAASPLSVSKGIEDELKLILKEVRFEEEA